jgi:hypothetical protein
MRACVVPCGLSGGGNVKQVRSWQVGPAAAALLQTLAT